MKSSLAELLKGHQFCLLTTYRKDGTAVGTPMWFAIENKTVYLSTRGQSGKVKRLRRDSKVKIGPCNGSGKPLGKQWEATGRVVTDESEAQAAEKCLQDRYGLKRRLLRWALRFAKDKTDALIAVTL